MPRVSVQGTEVDLLGGEDRTQRCPMLVDRGNVASAGHPWPGSGKDETEHQYIRVARPRSQVGLPKTDSLWG